MRKNLIFLLCFSAFALVPARAQNDKLTERLLQGRYELSVQDGHFSGAAASVLQEAVSGAQYVLIGEDHGIAQIPQFASGICDLVGPQNFHTLAVETGPLAAQVLESMVTQKDGRARLMDFEKKYSETIAFYNFQEEFDWLSHCAQRSTGGKFRLWGLDQELMGASGLILQRILDAHPGKSATEETKKLLQKNNEAYAVASKSGNPGEIFMMSAQDSDLKKLGDLLRAEGSTQAQALFHSLMESREIYQKNMNGSGFDSNRQRALLMKANFEQDYKQAARAEGHPPKVLFKFGAWHMYKGFNPLHNNDVGNMIMELADGQGTRSLHIAVLAVKGSQLRFAGIGHAFQPGEFDLAKDQDSDFPFLKPTFDNLLSHGWTLFDLRGLRKGFKSLGPVDKELERMIFGYDFLVLIPQATPSRQIH